MQLNYYSAVGVLIREERPELLDNEVGNYLKGKLDDFLASNERKFGHYEKRKYIMHLHNECRSPIYFFTTTRYNDKEALELLHELAERYNPHNYRCLIFRIKDGVKTLLYKTKNGNRRLTKEKKEFIIENYNSMPQNKMAKYLNLDRSSIYKFRKKNGLLNN